MKGGMLEEEDWIKIKECVDAVLVERDKYANDNGNDNKEDRSYCVYCHINLINGKKYFGQTRKKPEKRWANGRGYYYNTHFTRAIEKYGWDNFEHKIIETKLTKKEANCLESKLIEEFDTMNQNKGYNMTQGGDGTVGYIHTEETKEKLREKATGREASEETKRKISEATKGENNPFYGRHHTEESKQKLSKAHIGIPMPEHVKEKLSIANKDRIGEKNPFYGKKHSEDTLKKLSEIQSGEGNGMYGKRHTEESKRKMSEAKIGKRVGTESPRAKRVVQYDLDGNYIKTWDYTTQAANELGINISGISSCCNGDLKSAGGFLWSHEDSEPINYYKSLKTAKKPIVQYSINGDFIKKYNSIIDASLETGIHKGSISACCRNKYKTAGGYIWKFYYDVKDELENKQLNNN